MTTTTPRLAPSPISGSIGRRIRIIFGETASEYLLVFDEEDDRKWQSYSHCNLWSAVSRQFRNCTAKGRHVTCIDFGPTGAWFMSGQKRDGSGHHSWWDSTTASSTIEEEVGGNDKVKASFGSNKYGSETSVVITGANGYAYDGIDDDLLSRIERIHQSRKTIHFVRLFHDDGYFISDSEGTEWSGVGPFLSKELKNGRGEINDVAFAEDGSWVVIRDDRFASSQGVPKEVTDRLNEFYQNQRARNQARQCQIQQHAAELLQQAAELARVNQERAAREERERAERERAERERVERERAARERVERERAERERAAKEATMATALVSAHLRELTREEESIRTLEKQLETRKRLFRASYESLPPSKRVQFGSSASISAGATPTSIDTSSTIATVVVEDCVVCQDRKAAHATVPCGHHCLCDECAADLVSSTERSSRCPLCRAQVQSTLKIYL
jgi:hypothetical protein